ncbi:MAG TPA: CoA transferase, partial [Albitalea sp.]|nr:CoA transferase [Albitalea sp.]
YRARGMIERITSADGLSVDVPGIVPKLSVTPGAITRRAPTLGEDTEAVLREIGVTADQLAELRRRGIA